VDRRPIDVKPADRQGAPAPVFREPGGDVRGETNPVPPKIQSQGEDKSPAPSSSPSGQGLADAKSSSKQAPSSPVSRELVREPTPSGSSATPPAMKLSGIVWSSEPSERLAVINSQVVKEGAIIEGVKVVEIGPTKVRLMHNGTPFEISINLFGK
jgi:type II secretory pathway component PulC